MKILTFVFSFMLLIAVSGCVSHVTMPDGNEYRALSRSEINRLILISRLSLKDNLDKKLITRKEYTDAMRNEPTVRIDYRGDRFGTATITWRTRDRKLEFYYHDDLTAEVLPCSFATSFIPPEERSIAPDKSIPGR